MQPTASRSGLDNVELRDLIRRHVSLFRPLVGASLLITGATGWFGVWMLDLLCMADDLLALQLNVTAVSRQPGRFLGRFPAFADDPRIRWVEADVRDLKISGEFTHFIHAAADTVLGSDSAAPRALFDTILDGTRKVVDAAGPNCKSVLLLSSGAVYGPARPDQFRFIETAINGPDPTLARNAYAEGKRAAEMIGAISANCGTPVRIARCFAFVGPHMPFDRHFAIGNFIADAVSERPIRIKSDGRPQRSYLYMTDLMVALLTILQNGVIGRAYNVGSEVAVSIEQLAHVVNRAVKGRGVIIDGVPSDPSDRYVPDTTRLRTELDFVPKVTLDEAISRSAAWYRARIHDSMRS